MEDILTKVTGVMDNAAFGSFDLNLGAFTISPNYLQAGAIVFLVFLLILTMARVRRLYINWSFQGASLGMLLGFLLALVIEGFLILSGHTLLTGLLGWKNAPKPIENMLQGGRQNLINVLGVSDTCD